MSLARRLLLWSLIAAGWSGCTDATTLLNPSAPTIDEVHPSEVRVQDDDLVLVVLGSGFHQESMVRWNGTRVQTVVVDDTELHGLIAAALVAQEGVAEVSVTTPSPGGGTSSSVEVPIVVPPAPVLHRLLPDSVLHGSDTFTLTAHGSDFIYDSRILWNGTRLPTEYVSATELRAAVGPELLETPSVATVAVQTEGPGGGTTEPRIFQVWSPTLPVLDSIDPDSSAWSSSDTVLTAHGRRFVPESVVTWNGETLATTYVDPTRIRAVVPAGRLMVPGPATIRVFSNVDGGGHSAALPFVVGNPPPIMTRLPSEGATAGGAGFDLDIHGRYFIDGASLRWNGSLRPATVLAPNRLRATVSAADVQSPGTVHLSVVNPDGLESDTVAFIVRELGTATADVVRLAIPAADICWDDLSGLIYASITAAGGSRANTVTAVDPTTATITGSVYVGSEPGWMSCTDDGQYLYVGLDGASAVRRVTLADLEAGLQFALPGGETVGDIAAVPGQPHVVAIARVNRGYSPPLEGVTVYDDGVARAQSSSGHTGGNRIEFTDRADILWGYNNSHTGFEFFAIGISPGGAAHIDETGGLISGFYTEIVGAGGRIYATTGEVVDPERRMRIGSFSQSGLHMTADPFTGRAFFIADGGIQVHDLNTYQHLGTLPLPEVVIDHPATTRIRLVRWGEDGLAFNDQDELFIIRSPLVAP